MAVEKSGIRLVAEQFTEYIRRLREVAKVQQEVFRKPKEMDQMRVGMEGLEKASDGLQKSWQHTAQEAKRMRDAQADAAKGIAETAKEMTRLEKILDSVSKSQLPVFGKQLRIVGEVLAGVNRTATHFVLSFQHLKAATKDTPDRLENVGRGAQRAGFGIGSLLRIVDFLEMSFKKAKGAVTGVSEDLHGTDMAGRAAKMAFIGAASGGSLLTKILGVISPKLLLVTMGLKLAAKTGIGAAVGLGAAKLGAVALGVALTATIGPIALAIRGIKLFIRDLKKIWEWLKVIGPKIKEALVNKIKQATGAIKEFIKASGPYAARVAVLGVALNVVGANAGYTAKQLDYATKLVEQNGITTESARKILVRFIQTELELAKAVEVSRVAQDLAVLANRNSSEAAEILAETLNTGNIVRLKTLGLVVNYTEAEKRLADSLGIKRKELTQGQKAQARANEIIERASVLSGVYANAQQSVAKQEQSLARLRDQAMFNIGSLTKITMRLRVEAQTKLYKAVTDLTYGFKTWGEIINRVYGYIKVFTALLVRTFKIWHFGVDSVEKSIPIWESVGREIHALAQRLVNTVVLAQHLAVRLAVIPYALEAIATGGVSVADAFKAMDATANEMTRRTVENLKTNLPSVFLTWKELVEGIKVDLDKAGQAGANAAQVTGEAFEAQKAHLEAMTRALEQVESVWLSYERNVMAAEKKYEKDLEKLLVKQAKERIKREQKLYADMAKLEKDHVKQEQKLIQDYMLQVMRDEQEFNRKREQERRRFELSQMQSLRQFQLSERRLAAEGDILGLIRLREDYELQQKEAKENAALQQQEAKDDSLAQQRIQAEDLARQLRELQIETEERRTELLTSYRQDLSDLQLAQAEQLNELKLAHDEQLMVLRESRDQQLEDLGRHLQQEQALTSEGYDNVLSIIARVFGDQGAADAVMLGWQTRAQSYIGAATTAMAEQMQYLEEVLEAIEEGQPIPRQPGTRIPRPPQNVQPGMREGGSGVVTGPATFNVEPGVTEAFSFMPLPISRTLNVNMAGGFDIRGAENASPGVVDATLERVVDSFDLALRKLRRR